MAELEAPALLEMVRDPKASDPVGREGRPHEPPPRLDEQVRTSFERSRGTYGYRRARRQGPLELLRGRDLPHPGQPPPREAWAARLPCKRTQQNLGHGRHRDDGPGRAEPAYEAIDGSH